MTQTRPMTDTNDIPQADLLWDVARVPEAVHHGAVTPAAIAIYLGNKVTRQGLYYAQAAQMLGLVRRDELTREYVLTVYGETFRGFSWQAQRMALRRLVLQREPLRRVVEALRRAGGLSRQGLAGVVQEIGGLADSTARRRAQTIAAWLCAVGLTIWRDGRLVLVAAPLAAPTGRRV